MQHDAADDGRAAPARSTRAAASFRTYVAGSKLKPITDRDGTVQSARAQGYIEYLYILQQ
jgi:hypothetical protein